MDRELDELEEKLISTELKQNFKNSWVERGGSPNNLPEIQPPPKCER